MKIDTYKLKSKLSLDDIENILYSLGVTHINKKGKYWSMRTICHNLREEDGDYNLSFYTDKKTFKCYSHNCEVYDIIALTQTRLKLLGEEYDFMSAVIFIINNSNLTLDGIQRLTKSKKTYDYNILWNKFLYHTNQNVNEMEIYDKHILSFFKEIFPFDWLEQGISIETMEKYGIGYYDRIQATTIPCFDVDNNLIGIRGRYWIPDDVKKHKYKPITMLDGTQYSFPTQLTFFGINHNYNAIKKHKKVILVESEKAVMKSDTWFGDDSITLGMYGKELGKLRALMLVQMGVETVTIMIDNDFEVAEIGDKKYDKFVENVNKIWELLSPYMKVEVCYNNKGFTDMYKENPFDFDRERFDILWNSRETIE